MNNVLIERIVSILNSKIGREDKRQQIKECGQNQEGVEKLLPLVVSEILSDSHLPITIKEPLRTYGYTISNGSYKELDAILSVSTDTFFNAVCGELLWNHQHETSYAKHSITSYYEELKKPSSSNEFNFPHMVMGVCRILTQYKVPDFPSKAFLTDCIDYIQKHNDSNSVRSVNILEALTKCRLDNKVVEQTYVDSIRHFEEAKEFMAAIAFQKSLRDFYISEGRKGDAKRIAREIAKDCEKSTEGLNWSEPKNARFIIGQLQEAMNYWQLYDPVEGKAERNRLAKLLRPQKKNLLMEMQIIQTPPIDLSDTSKHIKERLSSTSLEEAIYILIHLRPIEKISDRIKQNNSFSFQDIFPSVSLDREGRKRYVLPPATSATDDQKRGIMERKISEEFVLFAGAYIRLYLGIAKAQFTFSEETLQFLVEKNVFVPTDRKASFLRGLVAGFNGDLITSMSILMPQVENAIRVLAEECGAVVYKTNEDGTEECLSLESILRLPEFTDCIDEALLDNMRLFYTSKYGFGMRNTISHGLDSDGELNSAGSLAVWWFTLHLCCIFSYGHYQWMVETSRKNASKSKDTSEQNQ